MGRDLIVSGPGIGHWVAEKTNGCYSSDTATAIGLQKDTGEIIAGVMYENWNGCSVIAHMAITGRLTRKFIGAIFRYAFVQCAVEKVILPIGGANQKSRHFAEHLGFTEECRIRDADPGGDIIFYTLRKPDCRFLGEKYG